MRAGSDSGAGLPHKVELGLGCWFLSLWDFGLWVFIISLFWLLGISSLELVAVFEVPATLADWFVVLELAFEENAVRVNPFATLDLASAPLTEHLHASNLA